MRSSTGVFTVSNTATFPNSFNHCTVTFPAITFNLIFYPSSHSPQASFYHWKSPSAQFSDGNNQVFKIKWALWDVSTFLTCKLSSSLSHTCTHTHTHTHTQPPCFPRFPWQPVVKEQRIQGQVCLQMRVLRIICPLWHYHQPISSSNTHSCSLTLIRCRVSTCILLWGNLNNMRLTTMLLCLPDEFSTSADHAVFICCLVCVCVCECVHHMFGSLTYRNKYKHRHTPIWSLIRRPDCPDFTLSTKHEQLSINNRNVMSNVFITWYFLGRKKH